MVIEQAQGSDTLRIGVRPRALSAAMLLAGGAAGGASLDRGGAVGR
ncbi:hypothetical protein [Paracidovorax cattleyae]|nr:hypothetical protein [Paracidovorax cattleyae]